MKTANVFFKLGFFGAVMLGLGIAGSVSAQTSYCDITLRGCPQRYDGETIEVPLNVIALSTQVRACDFQDVVTTVEPPAVMFIIDHSTSMDKNNVNNDVNGNRFRVTKALIDSIYKVTPDAEVGVAIFANGLVFSADRDNNLVPYQGTINPKAPPALANQSYMPLLQLDKPAKTGGSDPFYTGATPPNAIDVYRSMFDVTQSKAAITGGPETQSGTDISIAFEAAVEAFKNTPKPKEHQYIIFLSDGDALINRPGDMPLAPGANDSIACPGGGTGPSPYNPRCAMLNNFTQGTGVPTTYTVFLQLNNPATPASIATMTRNIQNNGYSTNNTNSRAWALTSDYGRLLSLMMDNIITPMLSPTVGNAKTIVISRPGTLDLTGSLVNDSTFNFDHRLPMDTTDVTAITMRIHFNVQTDSDIGDDDRDSVYTFFVKRTANPPGNWKSRYDLDSDCKTPNLDLRYNGNTVVGSVVEGHMDSLQIVFDPSGSLFEYDNVVVQVLNADATVSDLENYTLVYKNGVWNFTFNRTVSSIAIPGDKKLQHAGRDSIILVFRNEKVPLDTIRLSVPFLANRMEFYDKGDTTGTKLPDVVELKADSLLEIYALLFSGQDWNKIMSQDESKFSWSIEGLPAPEEFSQIGYYCRFRTPTSGGVYTVTATYTDGDLVLTKTIKIRVKPGDPKNTAGPNPFVPGSSSVMDHLTGLSDPSGGKLREIYETIVKGSASGGGPALGGAGNVKGILIAATATGPIKQSGGGSDDVRYALATAIIYDAVGHVVFKSKREDIVMAEDGNTFGFVWSGKNMAGRTVGPGAYLMRMTTTMNSGEKFSYQRMIGVTMARGQK